MRGGAAGDLLCRVLIETPVSLSARQKELLREFEGSIAETPERNSPKAKHWFDGMKKFFEDLTK